ncbi:unnamed protein product [Strongylus vulgaris]|uniref:Uncharacterized protein n=1 Tax=Strongylus vulgaris TaxID=40348 RepID=A0A3P7JUK8_STRVU|nr:unnamed protein product [Strongylus vulgaris]VDM84369.1 unnamed protein product [Strongylus vulgaris]
MAEENAESSSRPKRRPANRPDSTTARRTRMLRKIKIEDDHLRKLADEIMAEKRRLCIKREELALALREKEQAEGN